MTGVTTLVPSPARLRAGDSLQKVLRKRRQSNSKTRLSLAKWQDHHKVTFRHVQDVFEEAIINEAMEAA